MGGILPEGEKRDIIARNLGISAKNDVAMLEQIGGECAGAVTFISSGTPFPDRNAQYRLLTDLELEDILRKLPRRPLLAGEEHVRLSLAGAQNKIAVYVAEEQISLPLVCTAYYPELSPKILKLRDTADRHQSSVRSYAPTCPSATPMI